MIFDSVLTEEEQEKNKSASRILEIFCDKYDY
jgi:hypothetical protein